MSMVKRGISHLSIVECSTGDDMVRCPHCDKFISLKSTQNNENKCKYCNGIVPKEESSEEEKKESAEEAKTEEVAV
jgi:primosomal protein N'